MLAELKFRPEAFIMKVAWCGRIAVFGGHITANSGCTHCLSQIQVIKFRWEHLVLCVPLRWQPNHLSYCCSVITRTAGLFQIQCNKAAKASMDCQPLRQQNHGTLRRYPHGIKLSVQCVAQSQKKGNIVLKCTAAWPHGYGMQYKQVVLMGTHG